MSAVADHPAQWLTAAPLWGDLLDGERPGSDAVDRMHRPALLRMASDDFMDDLQAMLAEDPAGVGALEARAESYRAAPPGAGPEYRAKIDRVKLFQPLHGHFNLVAATLVCRRVGLPDKTLDGARGDEAAFVLRRLADGAELGWDGEGWVPVQAGVLAAREQRVPLFGMSYSDGDRRRRLFVGLVPTASLDAYKSGGPASLSPQAGDRSGPPPDRRPTFLDEQVVDQLRRIRASAAMTTPADRLDPSRFLLLDLAGLLQTYVGDLWTAVVRRSQPSRPDARDAYDLLARAWADDDHHKLWLDVLLEVWGEREAIWGEPGPAPGSSVDLALGDMQPDELRAALVKALPPRTPADMAEPRPDFAAPMIDPRSSVRYVVRCVYRRPACGPLRPDVLSDASQPFSIASFFDLDAPARQIHIPLPTDVSIAGLRKAPKNVSFLLSRELRGQMDRVKNLEKAIKGEIAAGESVDVGMICSFSIPIITICALMLLIAIVFVLNIVFWWVPFFRLCFPIPLKKGD